MSDNQSKHLYGTFSPAERATLVLSAIARRDMTEAQRLRDSCPRITYIGRDADFDDRLLLLSGITTVACVDFRALAAQLGTLHSTIDTIQEFATLHHINAAMAFIEGAACGLGKSQTPFYAKATLPLESRHDSTDSEDVVCKSQSDSDHGDHDPPGFGNLPESSRRMQAVEEQSERTTKLILRLLDRSAQETARKLLGVWEAFGHCCESRAGVSPEAMLRACGYPAIDELLEAMKPYVSLKPDPQIAASYRQTISRVWDGRFED